MEIVRLQEELDAANKKLREIERQRGNITEGRDWTWHDRVDDIAARSRRQRRPRPQRPARDTATRAA